MYINDFNNGYINGNKVVNTSVSSKNNSISGSSISSSINRKDRDR